jgi:hypothetical protein
MEHLDHPGEQIWEERRAWFERVAEEACGSGSYLLSEQACALIVEVQAVFCTGAWVSVVILAMAVVDAQLRETEEPGFDGNTARLVDAVRGRNALVHVDPDKPAITVDRQWSDRAILEQEARDAVLLMFRTFYMSPWL